MKQPLQCGGARALRSCPDVSPFNGANNCHQRRCRQQRLRISETFLAASQRELITEASSDSRKSLGCLNRQRRSGRDAPAPQECSRREDV